MSPNITRRTVFSFPHDIHRFTNPVVRACAKTDEASGKQSGNCKTRLGEAYARAEPIIARGLSIGSM